MNEEDLVEALARIAASNTTLWRVLEAVIESHPDPQALHRAWIAQHAESIDAEMAKPTFAIDDFRAALADDMREMTRLIERAADGRRRTGGGST